MAEDDNDKRGGPPDSHSARKPFAKRGGGKPTGSRPGGPKPFAKRLDRGGKDQRPARSFEKGQGPQHRGRPSSHASGAEAREAQRTGGGPTPRPPAPSGAEQVGSPERIAKRLARAGIASRRDAEALIAAGRVRVNGAVLSSPAFNVTASDRIELDGTEIPPVERTRLFLFHKPAGVVTTNRDPEGRRTVFDVLPEGLPRLMTVGRLDINTEGLLLLTNDGGLARILELPATGWLRRYRVRVHGKVDAEALARLKDGIAVDGVFYGSVEASLDREQGANAWLTIGLREGKNREVRNILGALGLEVTRLIRVSYGPFQLGELVEGAVQELKGRTLRDQLGERLIEESGANFEAPIVTPFSNKPVREERTARPDGASKPKIVRDGVQGRIGEGGLIKQRRRDRGDERASALSRLTTKPDRPGFAKAGKGKPFAPGRDKREERQEPVRARTSNVWMAPGARPQGKRGTRPFSSPEGEMAAQRPERGRAAIRAADEASRPGKARPPGPAGSRSPAGGKGDAKGGAGRHGKGGGAPRSTGRGGNADRRR
jgi:23S rRNA pseudouridine2605 synthase